MKKYILIILLFISNICFGLFVLYFLFFKYGYTGYMSNQSFYVTSIDVSLADYFYENKKYPEHLEEINIHSLTEADKQVAIKDFKYYNFSNKYILYWTAPHSRDFFTYGKNGKFYRTYGGKKWHLEMEKIK